jgi:CheY-like chemotaxis protein
MERAQHQRRGGTGLDGRRILIVEDEVLIAEDLADYFSRLGCEVLGPAGTLADGFSHLGLAEIAVLDISLGGETVFPLAEALLARGVPFVFFTARAGLDLPARFAGIGRFAKPAAYDRMGKALADRLVAPEPGLDDDLVRLLPKLRISARLLVQDPAAADRLVERALERALATIDTRAALVPLEEWIVSIMKNVARDDARRSMI